jgi:4-coumarate--CoA ligase
VPQKLAVWDWLFDSEFSPLARYEDHELKGYLNAVTNKRLNWKEVKEYSTYISTALVKKYGLKEGQTVSLFSQNSIWYPVVMHGCLRAGNYSLLARPSWLELTV